MGYSEYFNSDGCGDAYYYANYRNACGQSYGDYLNCETSWRNSAGSGTYYNNYRNCEESYANHSNRGYHHYNYSNTTTYTNYNTGSALSLSWSPPWSGNSLTSTYIAESVAGLKELRANMLRISNEKSQQSASIDLSTSSPNVGNAEFDAPGPDFVEDNQYDALKDSLDNLWAAIKGDDDATTPEAPVRNAADKILKTDFELLKTKTDALAAYGDTADYLNHINYTGATPCSTYPTDANPTGAGHSNHGNYANA